MAFEKLKNTLEKNGYTVSVFATGKEAADYLAGEVKGMSVGMGGSMTLKEMGMEDRLKENNTVFWHWSLKRASSWAMTMSILRSRSSKNHSTSPWERIAIRGRLMEVKDKLPRP